MLPPGYDLCSILQFFCCNNPFWLFSLTHRKLGDGFGYFFAYLLLDAFDIFILNAEVSLPGWIWQRFANDVRLIQWYEYTGVPGGTLLGAFIKHFFV